MPPIPVHQKSHLHLNLHDQERKHKGHIIQRRVCSSKWKSSSQYRSCLTMQIEKGLWVKIFRVQAVPFLPHLLQLILATLRHGGKIPFQTQPTKIIAFQNSVDGSHISDGHALQIPNPPCKVSTPSWT